MDVGRSAPAAKVMPLASLEWPQKRMTDFFDSRSSSRVSCEG